MIYCSTDWSTMSQKRSTGSQAWDFSRFFSDFRIFYKSLFASTFSWKKGSSYQGKKGVACIVSKPLISCLWRCGESVTPPQLTIQEVQQALSSSPKAPYLFFRIVLLLSNHIPGSAVWETYPACKRTNYLTNAPYFYSRLMNAMCFICVPVLCNFYCTVCM